MLTTDRSIVESGLTVWGNQMYARMRDGVLILYFPPEQRNIVDNEGGSQFSLLPEDVESLRLLLEANKKRSEEKHD